VLRGVLGPENVASEPLETLTSNRFSVAELYGKLANVVADLPSTPLRYTGIFKQLTGGDSIRAEKKNQHPFTFVNEAKLIFSCNEPPQVDDRTTAFWRRWIFVLFEQDFTGREDRQLVEKLLGESAGVFNWMVDGLKKLQAAGGFYEPEVAKVTKEDVMNRADSLRWFVSECVQEDPTGRIPKPEFYELYYRFCGEHRVRSKSMNVIGRELPSLLPSAREAKDHEGHRYWEGASWKAEVVEPQRPQQNLGDFDLDQTPDDLDGDPP
jgi:putative DNA primase/helicase